MTGVARYCQASDGTSGPRRPGGSDRQDTSSKRSRLYDVIQATTSRSRKALKIVLSVGLRPRAVEIGAKHQIDSGVVHFTTPLSPDSPLFSRLVWLYEQDQIVQEWVQPVDPDDCLGSTPFPRKVLKGLKTSDLAGRLYGAFLGCGTVRCNQTGLLAPHHVSDRTGERHAPA